MLNIRSDRSGYTKMERPQVLDDNFCPEFWAILNGSPDDLQDAAAGGDDAKASESPLWHRRPVLYCCSDRGADGGSRALTIDKVAEGKLKLEMLDSSAVYLVDKGTVIYIWVGRGADRKEKTQAMIYAEVHLASGVPRKGACRACCRWPRASLVSRLPALGSAPVVFCGNGV